MKKGKKFLAMFMALIMCLSFNATVFADDGIPEGVEKHTIVLDVPAVVESGEPGIQPQMWDEGIWSVNNTTYTVKFTIPDRYFCYVISATDINGNAISGNYSVGLCETSNIVPITFISSQADGSSKRNDWISVNAGEEYLFKIENVAGTMIKVHIVYYSWNS